MRPARLSRKAVWVPTVPYTAYPVFSGPCHARGYTSPVGTPDQWYTRPVVHWYTRPVVHWYIRPSSGTLVHSTVQWYIRPSSGTLYTRPVVHCTPVQWYIGPEIPVIWTRNTRYLDQKYPLFGSIWPYSLLFLVHLAIFPAISATLAGPAISRVISPNNQGVPSGKSLKLVNFRHFLTFWPK